jgi:4-hydroxy-tetrahydrodipicolinate synthase
VNPPSSATEAGAWTWDQALTGVVPPLISPLLESGALDRAAQHQLIDHVLGAGCTGLFVLGGCGEGAWLSSTQRAEVVRGAVSAAAARAPVLVGVMLPASGPAADAARQAEDGGADALVAGSPYYGDTDDASQERHIAFLLRATNLPVLLYNIPAATRNVTRPAVAARLATEARVLGIKDSSGDMAMFQGYLAIKRQRAEFRVLQGNEPCASASLLLGGDGLVPGMANFEPSLFVALRAAARIHDLDLSGEQQARITDLWSLHSEAHWLVALKTACAIRGLGNGIASPPLAMATEEQRRAIETILRQDTTRTTPS